MFHRDESKIRKCELNNIIQIAKTRSPFSRFASYIRSAFGRDHTPSKKDKTHGSMDDLNRSTPNNMYSNNSSLKVG